jgi:excisionase family DNA binding protein
MRQKTEILKKSPFERIRHISDQRPAKSGTGFERLLTPKEAADLLRVSLSWLAKARMRGDGPAYVKVGRSIRYREADLLQWTKSQQRWSTCQP